MKQTQLLVLAFVGVVWLAECSRGSTLEEKFACYGSVGNCTYTDLTCDDGLKAFILRADYGHQPNWTGCPNGAISDCKNDTCCRPVAGACYQSYTEDDFNTLYWKCWERGCLDYQVPWKSGGCPDSHKEVSGFVRLQQVCLSGDHIVDIDDPRSTTGSLLAIRYQNESQYRPGFWQCRVEVHPPDQVDLMVVKERNSGQGSNCSNLSIDGSAALPCSSTNVTYKAMEKSESFTVDLFQSSDNSFPVGWVVMQAAKETNLTVTCGQYCGDSLESCTDAATTLEATSPDTSTPGLETSTASSSTEDETSSTEPSTTGRLDTSQTTQTTDTPDTPEGLDSTPEESTPSGGQETNQTTPTIDTPGTTEGMNTAPEPSGHSNTGAIVGGVVAAVVVLVAVVVGVYCVFRRSRQGKFKPEGRIMSTFPPPVHSATSSKAPPSTAAKDSGYEEVVLPEDGSGPKNSRVESECQENGQVGDASESDYDRLGEKKTQSSNPSSTYGRLGEVGGGGEDTDYSYDHLTRGPQSARNVVNSDYDTVALQVT